MAVSVRTMKNSSLSMPYQREVPNEGLNNFCMDFEIFLKLSKKCSSNWFRQNKDSPCLNPLSIPNRKKSDKKKKPLLRGFSTLSSENINTQ